MFINKIKVDKYKKLMDFEMIFLEENIKQVESRKMNISVIVGENGTAKTTLFQLILAIFTKNIDEEDTLDYKLEYNIEDEVHIVGSNYDNKEENFPAKLIISSYTPIDKLKINSGHSTSCPVEIVGRDIDKSMVRNASNIITKNYLNNDIKAINNLVKYIGYLPDQFFLEVFRGIRNSSNYVKRILRQNNNDKAIVSIIEELDEHLSTYSDEDRILELTYQYEKTLSYKSGLGKSLREKFETTKLLYSNESTYFNNRILLEYLFIVEKIKLFEREHSQLQSTKYKRNRQRLINIKHLKEYIGGVFAFERDIKFLEAIEISVFGDTWFIQGDELVPMSMWSSGELSLFLRLLELHENVSDNSIVLIDEPETHLHPKWISGYINTLKALLGQRKCHIIIATHSPLIISDVQNRAIVGLKKQDSRIIQYKIAEETLGLSYETVLNEVFGLENTKGLMLNEYVTKIEKFLVHGKYENAFELYNKLADSQEKFELFMKLKQYLIEEKKNV